MSILVLVPLLPLAAAALMPLAPRYAPWLCAVAVAASGAALWPAAGARAVSATWLDVGVVRLTVGLGLDGLSLLAAATVASVGVLVTIYAAAYQEPPTHLRFFSQLAFFLAAMLTLVTSTSLLLLFAAWEAVGVASYLLIGFHVGQDDARAAAPKAFLMTRLSDLALLAGWLLLALRTGTTELGPALEAVAGLPAATVTPIAFLFVVGAAGKSAQLPLTAWLPDAMAGPTPVSALLHSATMVAAGVYLLVRVEPLLRVVPAAAVAVAVVGGASALSAALVATAQRDLKRLLAYSTVANLGEMLLAVGLGGAAAGAFHLVTHAAFKAALFLAAGIVGLASGGYALGRPLALTRRRPVAAAVFGVAALALAGVPPLAGYFSEEGVLAWAVRAGPSVAALVLVLLFLSGAYIGRAWTLAFAPFVGGARGAAGGPRAAAHLGPARGAAPGRAPGGRGRRSAVLLLAPAVVLAAGAAGLGFALDGRVAPLLGAPAPPEHAPFWTVLASAAGVAGLVLGVLRAVRDGAAPALAAKDDGRPWTRSLELAVEAPVVAARAAALWAAEAVERGERRLDLAVRAAASGALGLAGGVQSAERRGFAAGGDGLAAGLAGAGEVVRRLQTGRLYLYTLVVLAFALATLVLAVVLWA